MKKVKCKTLSQKDVLYDEPQETDQLGRSQDIFSFIL